MASGMPAELSRANSIICCDLDGSDRKCQRLLAGVSGNDPVSENAILVGEMGSSGRRLVLKGNMRRGEGEKKSGGSRVGESAACGCRLQRGEVGLSLPFSPSHVAFWTSRRSSKKVR